MLRRPRVGLTLAAALVLGLNGSAAPAPPAGFLSAVAVDQPDRRFGGFSAILVSADGAGFVALSDRATLMEGVLLRDPSGLLVAVRPGALRRLSGPDGARLHHRRADSEGLARAPDGTTYAAFELDTRVARLDPATGRTTDLPHNPAFDVLPDNGALEALAVDAEGTLYAVPERTTGPDIPVYRFRDGAWIDPLTLPRLGTFLPVAADIGPDGRFYLLERRFHGLAGFSSRLRRFALTPAGFGPGATLLQTPPGLHDNLEGLAVWRSPGGLLASMIADDNFNPLQHTEIVEYRLPD